VRRAVIHVNLDPAGELDVDELERAVSVLRDAGSEVIAGDFDKLPPRKREIELLHDGNDVDELRRIAESACATAVGRKVAPRVVAVSFMSTGTEEDALGIVRAFGLEPHLEELRLVDEDVAVVVLEGTALQRGVSAKLQTALECALNREVELRD
jgi:hypothetical protein